MIKDQIEKTEKSLEERGLPSDSYFEVEFKDGSTLTEKEANWSSFCKYETVERLGQKQICFISKHPVKNIRIVLNGLEAKIEVPENAEVYQYMRSERILAGGNSKDGVTGRGIGLVVDGIVTEELFISAVENKVLGMKK